MGSYPGTTMWSRVLAAAGGESRDRHEALDYLIGAYWQPVYHLFRRLGVRGDEAPDLVQEFFTHLMERNVLEAADPDRGRFRAFLRTSARNFLIHEWERRGAKKRGGGAKHFSLDFGEAERRFEPGVDDDPERAFDRQWAQDLVQACVLQLESELKASGDERLFRAVQGAFALDRPPEAPTYARIAGELSIGEQDVANFLLKARRRLREIMRERVRESVASEDEIDDEIRNLFDVLKP